MKLLGYCYEGVELLLVYEFMQKGSLENHLFGSKNSLYTIVVSFTRIKDYRMEVYVFVIWILQEGRLFSHLHGIYG